MLNAKMAIKGRVSAHGATLDSFLSIRTHCWTRQQHLEVELSRARSSAEPAVEQRLAKIRAEAS